MKHALAALALIAGVPFALTFCAPHEQAIAAPVDSAASTSASVSAASVASTTVAASAPSYDDASAPSSPVAASSPPPLPRYRGPIPKDCAAIDRAAQASFNEGSCKSDSDCTTGNIWCSCYAPITTSAAAKLEALNSAFEKKDCYSKMPPRPCATCAPPPEVKCANGKCTTR